MAFYNSVYCILMQTMYHIIFGLIKTIVVCLQAKIRMSTENETSFELGMIQSLLPFGFIVLFFALSGLLLKINETVLT